MPLLDVLPEVVTGLVGSIDVVLSGRDPGPAKDLVLVIVAIGGFGFGRGVILGSGFLLLGLRRLLCSSLPLWSQWRLL